MSASSTDRRSHAGRARRASALVRGGDGGVRVAVAQRARILRAAERVLAHGGYAGMSVARVCADAGVSRRAFYELFADREACFLALFEAAAERAREAAIAGYERESGPWSEKARGGVRALLGLLDERPALRRVLVLDAPLAGERVLRARARLLAELVLAVADSAPRRLAVVIAECVVGGALGVLHMRLVADPQGATGGLESRLAGMIVLPYMGGASGTGEGDERGPAAMGEACAAQTISNLAAQNPSGGCSTSQAVNKTLRRGDRNS